MNEATKNIPMRLLVAGVSQSHPLPQDWFSFSPRDTWGYTYETAPPDELLPLATSLAVAGSYPASNYATLVLTLLKGMARDTSLSGDLFDKFWCDFMELLHNWDEARCHILKSELLNRREDFRGLMPFPTAAAQGLFDSVEALHTYHTSSGAAVKVRGFVALLGKIRTAYREDRREGVCPSHLIDRFKERLDEAVADYARTDILSERIQYANPSSVSVCSLIFVRTPDHKHFQVFDKIANRLGSPHRTVLAASWHYVRTSNGNAFPAIPLAQDSSRFKDGGIDSYLKGPAVGQTHTWRCEYTDVLGAEQTAHIKIATRHNESFVLRGLSRSVERPLTEGNAIMAIAAYLDSEKIVPSFLYPVGATKLEGATQRPKPPLTLGDQIRFAMAEREDKAIKDVLLMQLHNPRTQDEIEEAERAVARALAVPEVRSSVGTISGRFSSSSDITTNTPKSTAATPNDTSQPRSITMNDPQQLKTATTNPTPTTFDRFKTVAVNRAKKAGERIAARQFSATLRPVILNTVLNAGGIKGKNRATITAFFATEVGRAVMDGLLSMAVPLIPALPAKYKESLTEQLQVGAMDTIGNTIVEAVAGPLMAAASQFLAAAQNAERIEPITPSVPPAMEAPKASILETQGISIEDKVTS